MKLPPYLPLSASGRPVSSRGLRIWCLSPKPPQDVLHPPRGRGAGHGAHRSVSRVFCIPHGGGGAGDGHGAHRRVSNAVQIHWGHPFCSRILAGFSRDCYPLPLQNGMAGNRTRKPRASLVSWFIPAFTLFIISAPSTACSSFRIAFKTVQSRPISSVQNTFSDKFAFVLVRSRSFSFVLVRSRLFKPLTTRREDTSILVSNYR